MKIILDDINYKGRHFDRVELDIPKLDFENLESVPQVTINEYIKESLDNLINED